MKSVSVQDLKQSIDAGQVMTIVDVQSHEAYNHRHIPGAVHLDAFETCGDECKMILKDKDSQVVVYGEFDELGKGTRGTEALEAAGYTNVARLEGGLMRWMEAGYPVEGGQES